MIKKVLMIISLILLSLMFLGCGKPEVENPAIPKDISYELDGKELKLSWKGVEDATGYEITINDKLISAKDNSASFKVSEGQSVTGCIRTVREVDSNRYYSDWVEFDYNVPVVNLADMRYYNTFLLDYKKLLEWAKYCGYSYKISEQIINEVNFYIVDISCKDSLNTGFLNALGRVAESTIDGFIGGYVSETVDSYTNDFSTVENILGTILANDSVKGYMKDVNESSKKSGGFNAITAGVSALLMDTDMHYTYYYTNDYNSAEFSMCWFLKNKRETYREDEFGQFEVKEDGKYHLFEKNLQQSYYLNLEEISENSADFWFLISSKK